MQFDPSHLAALSAILRLGSFEAAASYLSVTPSAISQRIKALEEQLGTVVIERGQPCTGTQIGIKLARHAEDVALLEAQLMGEIAPDRRLPARLRIAVNADSLATWFVPALAAVPGVLFELVIDDQDHSANWLRRGAVSAAVTGHATPVAGCDSLPLGRFRYLATASPGFCARWFARGVTEEALAEAPMMVFDSKDKLQLAWILKATGAALTPPSHQIPSTHGFVDAALAGLGWGMNPESLVRDHLSTGRLVELLADHPLDVPLYWQTSRLVARGLHPMTKAISEAARAGLS